MKIVKVITGLGLGGAETQLCLLSERMCEKGNDITIISLVGESVISPINRDIRLVELRMQKSIFGFIRSLIKLVSLFYEMKPDIIHAHMFHANIMARLASFLTLNCSRLICTAHSKNEGGRIRMFVYRLTDFMCSKTTNVSKEALDNFIALKAFKASKSEVVYNGLDFNRFIFSNDSRNKIRNEFSIPGDTKLILCVGRLTEAKDYPNLLNAIKCLSDTNVILLIVGGGELRAELERLVLDLGLSHQVIFAGIRNDVKDFYSASDLVVLSSRWEGFGLVLAEAMGAKSPVVSTNSGGVSEVIGCKDFLVPINDYQALATKISSVLSLSESEKENIVERNRKHVIDNFSIDQVVDKWLDIYKAKVRD